MKSKKVAGLPTDHPAHPGRVRPKFPALVRHHAGLPVAYFDGPGGTQVPRQVVDAVSDYLLAHNANTHWEYPTSIETDRILADSRHILADLLGARASEVVFGANMTTLTFHLARALGREFVEGDRVVVTELDHHANVAPWRALERDFAVAVRAARMIPETGRIDWSHLEELLDGPVRVLAIGAASNALGTITDVRRASELAHAAGAEVFVDAVHYTPHELPDVASLGCDFLACSAYKFYGTHVGVLWGTEDRLGSLDVPRLLPAPDLPPERLETGTQNHEGIAGAAAAVDFLRSLGTGETRRERLVSAYDALHAHSSHLLLRLWRGLSELPRVRLYGPPPGDRRTPTVAFTVDGLSPAQVARRLAERAVFVSHGDFYAATVVERLGLAPDGLVRAGCACYTTADEVERLLEGIESMPSSS